MSSKELGVATLDIEKSYTAMFGALELDADGHMSFDLYGTTYASIDMGDVFERPLENTFGGTLFDQSNGELKIMPTCPQDGDPFVSGTRLWMNA